MRDNYHYSISFLRTVEDKNSITDSFKLWGAFIRGLYDIAQSDDELSHVGEYHRFENDTVNADGSLFRHLSVFIKILITSFVRNFVLHRFLVVREELMLKSPVTREVFFDSHIT
jgi:hypothetical protein